MLIIIRKWGRREKGTTNLSYLSSFRRLFEWRKKQAEYDNELELIRPPAFASDIFSTMEELSVRYYI
jgi:hypothetical protein